MSRKIQAVEHIKTLRPFMSRVQLQIIAENTYGPEKHFFFDKLAEYAGRVQTMPKTYEQDGKGDEAIAHLHYFLGGCDWYITEKDAGSPDDLYHGQQVEAFGLAILNGGEPELGYISIEELAGLGVELDIHWTPKTLREIKGGE